MRNNIEIQGPINMDSYSSFTYELNKLEDLVSISNNKIYAHIEITSEGGASLDALAFASRIRRSPVELSIIAVGLVASAAVIILAAGKKGKRRMCKDAWLMVHEDSTKLKGSVTDLEKQSALHRRLEIHWCALLEEFTGTDRAVWAELHKAETYLSSAQCLSLGIIDEVV